MKKITTILTALILMFTLTFTTGCKKDGGIAPAADQSDQGEYNGFGYPPFAF